MPTPIGMYESPYESQQIDQQLAIKRATNMFDSTTQAYQAEALQKQQHDMMNYGMSAFNSATQRVDDLQPLVSQHVTDLFDQQNQAEQHQALQAYGATQLMSGLNTATQQLQTQQPQDQSTTNPSDTFAQTNFLPTAQQPSLASSVMSDDNTSDQPASDQDTSIAPNDYIGQARTAAQQNGINPDLFVKQIQAESNFNPQAASPAGATGIAQFMPDTAKGLGIDPSDPLQSLNGAAQLMASYGASDDPSTWAPALAKYNAGPSGDPNNPETQGYVSKVLGTGDASHPDPGVATAASAAIQAGARPADIAYAERNLDADAFKGLCEQFVETAETGHGGIASSASARWDQQADNRVEGTLKGIKVGDEVHFSDPNDPNGHVGIYDGHNSFISATDNGVKRYDINQWTKMTGQSFEGYVPIEGSTDDTQSASFPRLPGILGQAQDKVNQGLSAIGSGVSSLGSNLASLKTPAVDAIHQALTGMPFDQSASDKAEQERNGSSFGLDTNKLLQAGGNPVTTGLALPFALSGKGYSTDPVADMVNAGMNPVNPLDWSKYIGGRLLDTTTQGATGGDTKTFAESGAGKFPVLGGLIEGTIGDPLQLAAMVGTGGIEGAAGAAARAAAFGVPALSSAAEDSGATPSSTAAAGVLGVAGSLVPDVGKGVIKAIKPSDAEDATVAAVRDELTQLTGGVDPGEIVKSLAEQTGQPPEKVSSDMAHELVLTIGGGSQDNEGAFTSSPDLEKILTKALYDRYYHGTATSFDTPVPSADGLFGPGYYMTDDPRVAGGIVDDQGKITRLGYAQTRTADAVTDPAARMDLLNKIADLADTNLDNAKANANHSGIDWDRRKDQFYARHSIVTDNLIDQQEANPDIKGKISDYSNPQNWKRDIRALVQKGHISQSQLADAVASLEDGTGEAQIRPLDAPKDLNLFKLDDPIGKDMADRVSSYIDKGWLSDDGLETDITPETTGADLFRGLSKSYGNRADAVDFLQAAGFDGTKVSGGNITPMLDESGQPIRHNNVTIFEQSIPKVRNALTKLPEEAKAKANALASAIGQDPDMHANVKDIMTDSDLTPADRTAALRKAIGC